LIRRTFRSRNELFNEDGSPPDFDHRFGLHAGTRHRRRIEHLFKTNFSTGKPDTPSCTTCHTTDPRKTGQTRAGKDIEPMAASANSKRYSEQAKTEKWFGRNCNNVLGRECTATEKGDFITFMLAQ
jgi:hypothetical protein